MAGLIKLNNTSDRDFTDQFNGVPFVISAHGSELVPDGAMRLWLGDPDSRDYPRDRQRQNEFERLQTRYGTGNGTPDDLRGSWEEVQPQLEAYTVDGERILTVIDDPTGARGGTGAPVYTNEQLSRLAAEQAELIQKLNAKLDGQDVDVPTSGDERTPEPASDDLTPATDKLPPTDTPNRAVVKGK